jgi:putative ABC transport system substrate-binding protein
LVTTARSHGIDLSIYKASSPEEIGPALAAARAGGVQAIDVMASALFNANRTKIIASLAEAKLPAMYQWPEYGQEGALISYGPSIDGFYRQAARLIAKIFRGAKPAELPVEQPSRIALVINLKTARALSLAVPQSLLARADEVIE